MNTLRIHKEDKVIILTGRFAGKTAQVSRVFRRKNAVLLKDTNEVLRHVRKNPYNDQPGKIVKKLMPVRISNVMLICPACNRPTRVGYRFIEKDGQTKKVRFCKKCDEVIRDGEK